MKHHLNEASQFSPTPRVDEEKGIIYDVKLLGSESTNGYEYPEQTRLQAIRLLEGAKVNIDHNARKDPFGNVSWSRRFGKVINVVNKPSGTFGNVLYLTKHPAAPGIVEAAQKMPEMLGMSINGLGSGSKKNAKGQIIIESLDRIKSIDIVADPATVRSLYESEGNMAEEEMTSEDHYWEACKKSVLAELESDDEVTEKVKKIKEHLKKHEKMYKKDEEPEVTEEEKSGEEADVKEDISWKQEYEKLKLEKDCRILVESMNMDPEPHIIEILAQLEGEEARKAHLTYLKRKNPLKKTKASPSIPLQESLQETEPQKLLRYADLLRS